MSYLSFNVDLLGCVVIEPLHIDLAVEVSDVADDGVILHLLKVSVRKKHPSTPDAVHTVFTPPRFHSLPFRAKGKQLPLGTNVIRPVQKAYGMKHLINHSGKKIFFGSHVCQSDLQTACLKRIPSTPKPSRGI